MFSISIFGGGKIDGSTLDFGEPVTALVIFGGVEIDLATSPPPLGLEVRIISVFGGAEVKVRPQQAVRLSGFSFFGGREIESLQLPAPSDASADDDDADVPIDIEAYAIFGGVNVRREDMRAAAPQLQRK